MYVTRFRLGPFCRQAPWALYLVALLSEFGGANGYEYEDCGVVGYDAV